MGCYLRTARLYLDAIDSVGADEMGTLATLLASAETFVSRSAMLEKDVKDALLTLLYKVAINSLLASIHYFCTVHSYISEFLYTRTVPSYVQYVDCIVNELLHR